MTTPSRPDATGLLRTAAFALLFAGAAVVGRLTVVEGTGVNLVWPAAGVGALWLLLQRGRATFVLDCALLVAVVLATDLLTGEDLLVSGGLAAVNLGQAGLVVLLYRRLAGSTGAAGPLLLDMRDLGGLLLATGIATTAGAAVGTVVLAVADGSWSVLGLVVWQARNGAAVLVVVALGLRVRQLLLTRRGPVVDGMLPFRAPGGWRAVELVLAVAASVLGNVAVFHWMPEYPIAFPLFALTAWVALRFDTGLTVLRTAAVSVVAVVYTLQGEGPSPRWTTSWSGPASCRPTSPSGPRWAWPWRSTGTSGWSWWSACGTRSTTPRSGTARSRSWPARRGPCCWPRTRAPRSAPPCGRPSARTAPTCSSPTARATWCPPPSTASTCRRSASAPTRPPR
ncbi:hypothetical protein ACFQX8_08505 [Klenkia terrae]|uniref:hypothetical protein n=1 Tax=Klenkia terrae TaxID=1052259 RepID=UPI00361EF450